MGLEDPSFGTARKSSSSIAELRRLGVKYTPPTIILEYYVPATGKLRLRSLRLHRLRADSDVDKVTTKIFQNNKLLDQTKVSFDQVRRLVKQLADHLKGLNKPSSASSNGSTSSNASSITTKKAIVTAGQSNNNNNDEDEDTIEDLNKVEEHDLKRFKQLMEVDFERNRLKPGDPGFKYDVECDFNPTENNEWDEGDNYESDEEEDIFRSALR
eukprot:CAMPEP_0184646884 /NCGR_PEP_ID=MMETSP0308-20130426/3676_1 /TAXON_ID=38269 /ORGANISM="Gloeochaete witrockiana, Strain SAG 46.84" /LENGTH=212 /DNA_ID=CAMNT_0027077329 /DNA_START=132 /DNA_END=770 /DNA_ORIENTATION=+